MNEFNNCWSQETPNVRFFSHIITKTAYFKEINRFLSAVTASSKNRNTLSNNGTLKVILHVSKDKDFSTRCSNPETREDMWENYVSCGWSLWQIFPEVVSFFYMYVYIPVNEKTEVKQTENKLCILLLRLQIGNLKCLWRHNCIHTRMCSYCMK